MFLYLLDHTWPDLAFSVSQVARFILMPKKSHDKPLKQIEWYLLRTVTKGIILLPKHHLPFMLIQILILLLCMDMKGLMIQFVQGAGLDLWSLWLIVQRCGIWSYRLRHPGLQWKQKLLLELHVVVNCCRSWTSWTNLTSRLDGRIQTPMYVTIHEDKTRALVLADILPRAYTLRSKHCHKNGLVSEKIHKRGIKIKKIG